MTHPLTDEIIDTFASPQYDYFEGIGEINLGYDYDDLRAAADWQLEQVIEWLEVNLIKHGFHEGYAYLYKDLKKAMRPEVVDLPQANSDVCGEEGMERARQRTFEENDELMRKLSDS